MSFNLKWLVARLGDDMNWWVEETSDDVYWGKDALSVLDPNQVGYLRKELKKYEEYGFDPKMLHRAFHVFELSSELPDGRVKLVSSKENISSEDVPLFALPDLLQDEGGHYPDLLDRIAALRIQLLNATHDYHQDLTEQDMDEEIQTRNTDRYFSASAIHVFNELEDILTWKPAEWDDEEEESDLVQDQVENEDQQDDEVSEDEGEEDDSRSRHN
jgi:hypothetical protein